MSYLDGFEVIEKVKRSARVKCKACGKVTETRWGLAKKHAAKCVTTEKTEAPE